MRVVVIADTHGKHRGLKIPSGNMIIHAGDVSMKGYKSEVVAFLEWFDNLDFEFKIFIAGNHDFYFEKEAADEIEKLVPKGIFYLNDSAAEINGIKFWGSPVSPWFFNWAFNRHGGEAIKRHWDLIPDDINVLITHGPVFQQLDLTLHGKHAGCQDLSYAVHRIKPKFHICGHIHEAYGRVENEGTTFINASVLNAKYELVNAPVVFNIK